MARARGKFISFEGGEGAGKSTQIQLLSSYLTACNIDHIITREPGGTTLAERVRPLLVEPATEDWDPLAETLLFLAARLQHWRVKIQPALRAGQWVLCDRFTDSTLVYQGIAKGLGVEYLQQLQRMVLGDVTPDVTILLDIDPAIGLARAGKRGEGEDRFEQLGLAFHQRLRAGFLSLAAAEPARFRQVDAAQSTQKIADHIQRLCQ
jgi:dTMP kinase